MTRQTWEEERDAKRLEDNERFLRAILLVLEENRRVLEEILRRLPPPPRYRPVRSVTVTPTK